MNELKYRPDVDGLRAIAVLLVMFFHAGLGFRGGYIGVDVFFVISGFLITGLILKQQQAGTFSLSDFWSRRIRRIIPAASVLVFFTLIAGWLGLFPDDFEDLARSALAQQLMLGNFYFWKTTGYFEGPADLKPLLHMWSLAVEEQFYLVYPVLLILLRRTSPRVLVSLLGVIALCSLAISEWGAHYRPSAAFFLLPTRAWELLLGGLLCFAPRPSIVRPWQIQGSSLAGIGSILASAWWFDAETPFPGLMAAIPCFGTAILIYSQADGRTWVGRILATRPLVFLGLMSYSLYLWHWPLLAFARYWLGLNLPPALAAWVLVISFAAAYLSWRFVEHPFRYGISREQQPRAILAIGATLPMLILVCLVIVGQQGFPNRFSSTANEFRAVRENKPFMDELNLELALEGKFPSCGTAEGPIRCLVWGDSHAMALMPGIDAACKERQIHGVQATVSVTAPLLGFVSHAGMGSQSPAYNLAVFDFAVANEVDVVILSGVWAYYAKEPEFERHLQQTVDSLADAGISVAIVLSAAFHEDDVPLMLGRQASLGLPTDTIGVSWDDYMARNSSANEILYRIAQEKAQIIDPAKILTRDDGFWPAEMDGVAMYRDSSHLSVEGSFRLRGLFIDLFESALPAAPDVPPR